jgi:hypothetical protein
MGFPIDNNMMTNGMEDNSVTNGNGQWSCGDITSSTTGVSVSGRGNNTTVTLTFSSTTGIFVGMPVTDTTNSSRIPVNTFVQSVSSTNHTVTIPGQNVSVVSGDSIKFGGYWSTAHPTGTSGAGNAPAGCTAAATISRNSVYQYEITNNYVGNASSGGEVGGPTCSTSTPDSTRRYLDVAVVNCLNLENEGYSLQGNSTNIPVVSIAKYFLTLPVRSAQGPIFGEYEGIVTPGVGTANVNDLYSQIQLYR